MQFFAIIKGAVDQHIYTFFGGSLVQEFLYDTFLAIRFQDGGVSQFYFYVLTF